MAYGTICAECGEVVPAGTGANVVGRGLLHNRCAKLGKSIGREVRMVRCQNCHNLKPEGGTCCQCGVSERIG